MTFPGGTNGFIELVVRQYEFPDLTTGSDAHHDLTLLTTEITEFSEALDTRLKRRRGEARFEHIEEGK